MILKKYFHLRIPKIKHLFGAACLWFGTYLLAMIITNIIIYYFPQNQEIVEGLNNALFIKDNLLLNLLIVAVMPAICEEIFFRGFIILWRSYYIFRNFIWFNAYGLY